jgi:hypothetical protein
MLHSTWLAYLCLAALLLQIPTASSTFQVDVFDLDGGARPCHAVGLDGSWRDGGKIRFTG